MREHLWLLAALLTASCATPVNTVKPSAPTLATGDLIHVGDTLALTGAPTTSLTLTNELTGEQKPISVGAKLDASTLPGFDGRLALQHFKLTLRTDQSEGERSLSVVTDPSVQAFPSPPLQFGDGKTQQLDNGILLRPTPGPAAWTSKDSATGAADYIDRLKAIWPPLTQATVTSKTITRANVRFLVGFSDLPAGTRFTQYHLEQAFPTYLVPGSYTLSGEADVFAPTSLDLVVTQTEPADLVSLTANAP